jgi:hypothetical protein
MPRKGTKSLLNELQASGVRTCSFHPDGKLAEVEFWSPPGVPSTPEDRRERYLEERQRLAHEGKVARDPLAVAMEPIDVEEGAN